MSSALQISDRARRYRAQQGLEQPDKRCIYCGAPGARCVDHISGDERDEDSANLARACQSCNTAKGVVFARLGIGRKTEQYNPKPTGAGARNLAQWVMAVLSIKGRGPLSVPEAVEMIRSTPAADRSAYAAEIWRRRRAAAPSAPRRRRASAEDEDIPF